MSGTPCERIGFAELSDYAAGEAVDGDALDALEAHLFSCPECAARAAEFDALVSATTAAAASAQIGGFVTDAVLNRLARDGVRVRSYALSPGARVPCAVWDDDELMALRLRADLAGVTEITLSQWLGGTEVIRTTGEITGGVQGEVTYAVPAALIRQLPAAEVEIRLSAKSGGEERAIGSYTLVHGGALHR
jgi:anti-sigma factor RsiW